MFLFTNFCLGKVKLDGGKDIHSAVLFFWWENIQTRPWLQSLWNMAANSSTFFLLRDEPILLDVQLLPQIEQGRSDGVWPLRLSRGQPCGACLACWGFGSWSPEPSFRGSQNLLTPAAAGERAHRPHRRDPNRQLGPVQLPTSWVIPSTGDSPAKTPDTMEASHPLCALPEFLTHRICARNKTVGIFCH